MPLEVNLPKKEGKTLAKLVVHKVHSEGPSFFSVRKSFEVTTAIVDLRLTDIYGKKVKPSIMRDSYFFFTNNSRQRICSHYVRLVFMGMKSLTCVLTGHQSRKSVYLLTMEKKSTKLCQFAQTGRQFSATSFTLFRALLSVRFTLVYSSLMPEVNQSNTFSCFPFLYLLTR